MLGDALKVPLRHVRRWGSPLITMTLFAVGAYRRERLRLPHNRTVILVYHHVSDPSEREDRRWAPFQRGVSQNRFERQMRFLRQSMTPVSLLDAVAAVHDKKMLPPRAVVVTFDDGYQDNFTVAYPILKKYEIPATIFVTTSFIGTTRTFWWDQVYAILRNARTPVFDNAADLLGIACPTQESFPLTTFTSRVHTAETIVDLLRTLPQEKRVASLERLQSMLGLKSNATANNSFMMTWAQLQEMSQNGITIESHTHTHPILSLTDADTAKKEFSTSKRLLEEQLDRAIHGVAYPDGREGTYNNATRKIAEAVGFRFGCSTERGRVGPGSDPFSLGRMPVGNVSLPVFVRNLLRTYGID